MELNTMAAVMSFVSKIENDTSSFYQDYADKYHELKEIFLFWAKENKKFEKTVKQTYFGVITDAIESNFSFGDLNTDNFRFETILPENANLNTAKKRAQEIEDTIKDFYLKAAQLSEGLMADIPRLFIKIAKKREERSRSLDSL